MVLKAPRLEVKRSLPQFRGFPRNFSSFLRFQKYRSDETIFTSVKVALDGTGDYDDIQAAIDSLPDTGGLVKIKGGVYLLDIALSITKSNVMLRGEGKSTKVQVTSNIHILDITNVNGVVIESIYFYGDSSKPLNRGIHLDTTSYTKIKNCWVENCGAESILSGDGNYNIFINNEISNGEIYGIFLADSHYNLVKDNLVDSCAKSGIYIHPSDHDIVANNIVRSNGDTGILLFPATESLIIGNQVLANAFLGIYLINSDNNVISQNLCKDNDYLNTATFSGIGVYGSDENIISHNRCQDNDYYEIEILSGIKNIVVENICVGSDHVGSILDNGTETQLAHNVTD